MSYTSRQRYSYLWYYPSDTVLAFSDTTDNTTNTTPTKVCELQLKNDIQGTSNFRIKITIKCVSGGNGYGRVYRNDTAIGSIQSRNGDWLEISEDLTTTGWRRGDKLQLYIWADATHVAWGKNLAICGTSSQWEKTI